MRERRAEAASAAAAVQALQDAGYPLVLQEVARDEKRARADVVAYAPGSDGGLQPAVAVEVKKLGSARSRDDALDQLADARHTFGTRQHYVFDGAAWFEADSGLRDLHPVAGPTRNEVTGPFHLTDALLVERLLGQHWWRLADRHRGERSIDENLRLLVEQIAEERSFQVGDVQVPVDEDLLWLAARTLALRVQSERRFADGTTDQAVAKAMASIAGVEGRAYLDPFCGMGSLLWHVADLLQTTQRAAQLRGLDINADVVATAQAFARLCPLSLSIHVRDAFQPLPGDPGEGSALTADRVLAQPPLGLRRAEPYILGNGDATPDGDLASLDVCLRALQPGGRAVLHLGRGWTVRSGTAMRYRRFLAETMRVTAIIGLPPGAMPGTQVASVIAIFEKSSPGQTFVAQLEQDWQQQLSSEGEVLRALLAHLDEPVERSGLL